MTTKATHVDVKTVATKANGEDFKPVPLTEDTARALSVEIRTLAEAWDVDKIYRAHALKVWVPLGLKNWAEWCATYLPLDIARPTGQRLKDRIKAMHIDGNMSQRAVAETLGISQPAVAQHVKAIKKTMEASGESDGTDTTTATKPAVTFVQRLGKLDDRLADILCEIEDNASEDVIKSLRVIVDRIERVKGFKAIEAAKPTSRTRKPASK